MKSCIHKSILFFLLFLSHVSCAMNIRYIKDTYTILKPEYKQLSPAHGPVWWERKIAEHNYKYGGDPLAKYLFNVPQAHGAGALPAEDFVITRSEFFPATYATPKTVGRLLGAIEKTRPAILQAQGRVAEVKQKRAPQKGQQSAKQIASKKEVDAIKKDLRGRLELVLKVDSGVDAYLKGLPRDKMLEMAGKIATVQKKMIAALLDSLENSGFFELTANVNNPIFPPYQTYNILLAFLFRKAQDMRDGKSIGKTDFKDYFDGVVEQLEQDIFTPEGRKLVAGNEWLLDAYTSENSNAYRSEIKDHVLGMQNLDQQLLDQLYEKMVFAELSRPLGLPKIAAYRDDSLFAGQVFTDCMDTFMRNASNIALFDPATNTFTFAQVENSMPNEAAAFYETYNLPSEVENPIAHNAWNLVIQNRLYVAYERIVDLKNPLAKAKVGDQDFKGFMRETPELIACNSTKKVITFKDGSTNEFDAVEVNGTKFVLIDPTRYAAYEVEPTMRNIIILMNDILGLGLYRDINTAFFEPNFNTTYFTSLADRIGWEFKAEGLNLEAEKNAFTIQASGGSFDVRFHWGHGEIIPQNVTKLGQYQRHLFGLLSRELRSLVHANQLAVNSFMLNIFALYQVFGAGMFERTMHNLGAIRCLRDFIYYTQHLGHSSTKIEVIKSIVQTNDPAFFDMCASLILKLNLGADLYYLRELSSVAFDQTGQGEIMKALGEVYDVMFKRPIDENSIHIAQNFLVHNLFADKAMRLAQSGMASDNPAMQIAALKLFGALVRKGYGYDSAVIAARQGMASKIPDVPMHALDLFAELVEKNQATDEALVLAQGSIKSAHQFERSAALELFERLFSKNKGYKEAIMIAQDLETSGVGIKRALAFELFEKLFEKDQGYKEAIAIARKEVERGSRSILFEKLIERGQGQEEAVAMAQEGSASNEPQKRTTALHILEKLVERGQRFHEAIVAGQKGMTSSVVIERNAALELFAMLFAKEQGYREALATAHAIVQETGDNVEIAIKRADALKLLGKLVEIKQGYEVATQAAQRAAKSPYWAERKIGLDLFAKLVVSGQAYQPAQEAAERSLKNGEFEEEAMNALGIFEDLVEKGQAYQEAIKAAQRALADQDKQGWFVALGLLGKLVEKGQGYPVALEVAQQFIHDTHATFQRRALHLFEQLIEKGQGHQEAISIAKKSMGPRDNDTSLALKLFGKLFEKGLGYKEAIELAQAGMRSQLLIRRVSALKLFKRLVESGQAIPEATEAMNAAMGNQNEDMRRAVLELEAVLG